MQSTFYLSPPTADAQREKLCSLRERYPFLKVFPMGKSVAGRPLMVMALGQTKGATLMVGGVHSLEWLTTLLLFRFCEELLQAVAQRETLCDMDVAKILDARGLLLIPCLNPDGMELVFHGASSAGELSPFLQELSGGDFSRWQANAHGVDLNHNFDAGFGELKALERRAGILGPGPTRYGGSYPFSEPESRSLAHLCTSLQVHKALAFHSQGEEIYYSYGDHTPVTAPLMAQLLASSCGYRVAAPQGTASHGGFKDWFIDKLYRPGFTFEIGRGQNPLPVEDFPEIYETLQETLLLSLLL